MWISIDTEWMNPDQADERMDLNVGFNDGSELY